MNKHDWQQWWSRFFDSMAGCGVLVMVELLVLLLGGVLGFLLGRSK